MPSRQLPTLIPLGHAAIDPPRRPRPVATLGVRLGFPSPAEDFFDGTTLDLNELLVTNEPATFYYRARGNSMQSKGILDGDLLAVDRSLAARSGHVVVAQWDGNEPVAKTLYKVAGGIELHSGEASIPPICLGKGTTVEAFVVIGVVRKLNGARR